MQFPLPENRISNFAQCSSYLNSLTCQKCHALTLQQVICQVCHENLCIRCINQPDDQIPQPQELITESIPIYRNIKYQPDLMYRGECPLCQSVTLLSSTIPKLFHKLYINVKFQCQNRIHGCSEETCYPDLRLHQTKCNYNQLQCQTCQGVIFKKDWLSHISVCNPKNECVCGTTLRDSSEHNEQLCLKYQCETLKSQRSIHPRKGSILQISQMPHHFHFKHCSSNLLRQFKSEYTRKIINIQIMQFPVPLSYGMLLYSEDQGGDGIWSVIDSVELKIPKQWDLDGQMLDYNSYMVGEGEVLGTITIQHSTDLHHCANIKQLAHYQVQAPPKAEDFQYIFFKRQTDEDYIFIDIIGFNVKEPQFEALLNFVLTSMVYESRYSQLGIQKQVEDAVEVIMYSVLKKMIRAIGKIKNIQYTTMMELTGQVIIEPIKLESADIYSIVYKTMISKGLFPIHCEINTMNDSYFKLKLLSLFTNSEILPWSPKFHASLALANFHYSFTPNDLFNLRKLDQRKFHAGYQYIRLRILDFFPLDSWVEEISDFFCKHQMVIYYYLRKNLQTNERPQRSSSQSQKKNQQDEQTSRSSVLSELKQPFLGEEDKQIELMYDNRYINRKASFSFIDLPFQDLLKFQLKKSIQSLKFTQQLYGLEIEKFYLVEITKKIAREFYQNYSSELQDSGMMSKFCQIITETELRKYDTCANNCQTPVAAFIYQLCDTFREHSEVLYKKNKVIECLRSRTESVHIKNFVKYGSQVNQRILGAIQPAYLGQCLDYFGFFSDSLSSTFLKNIQKIDGNPYEFVRKRHSIFGSQGQESKAMEQINYFISLFETNQQIIMSNYIHSPDHEQESFRFQVKELDLHFLMQYFQNEVLKQKQENEKNAQNRHKTQDLLDEVFFYYFNSIRIQLQMKQKRKTLSYIGFVLAKDLDMIAT